MTIRQVPVSETAMESAMHAVLDKVRWTAGASDYNKRILTTALAKAVARTQSAAQSEAGIVMAALDTGEWVLERNHPDNVMDPERVWFLKRAVAPFCATYGPQDKRGMYGPRFWQGPTALAALQAATADLGMNLPGGVIDDDANTPSRASRKGRA